MNATTLDNVLSECHECEDKLENLRHLLHDICRRSNNQLFEFEIDEGRYVRVPEIGLTEQITKPLTGKTFIFSPEENNKYMVVSIDDISKLVSLYKSLVEELYEIKEGNNK